MSSRLTILGCGSSAGVPRIGNHWGNCNPDNSRNRRRRCSVLIERRGSNGSTRVLIDTSPDLREQLLAADTGELDAVFYTHAHADHTHGIDELRAVAINMQRLVPVYADLHTAKTLTARFVYAFKTPDGSSYPPILQLKVISSDETISIEGAGGPLLIQTFAVEHGDTMALGFRVSNVAYTPDLNGIPESSAASLQGLSCWIVDALRHSPHPSHWSLAETLDGIRHFAPARAIITNMHIDLDYDVLSRELPPGVEPAFDGMVIEIA
jgi:phosphoribosyl 1,2-cyclic phosphate phosphodiesterase